MKEEGEMEGNEVGDYEGDGGVDYVDEAIGNCPYGETAIEEEDGDFGHAGRPHVEDFYNHYDLLNIH